jgi:hypothetical protein
MTDTIWYFVLFPGKGFACSECLNVRSLVKGRYKQTNKQINKTKQTFLLTLNTIGPNSQLHTVTANTATFSSLISFSAAPLFVQLELT